jgi:superfamily I DNA/RNA helicase
VSCNGERFAKTITAAPQASGRLVLAPDGSDESARIRRVIDSWPDDGGSRAILARTNAELMPAAAVAVEMGLPFRAARLRLLTEDLRVDAIVRAARESGDSPVLPRLVELVRRGLVLPDPAPCRDTAGGATDPDRRDVDEPRPIETDDLLAAVVGWAAPHGSLEELAAAITRHRARIAELRREDAQLTLATAHATKGLEFDHVAVIGLEAGRFPSARSLRDSTEPERALEEERRLAYVAWTRARRSLTLVYDPATPSPFLLEAFTAQELDLGTEAE